MEKPEESSTYKSAVALEALPQPDEDQRPKSRGSPSSRASQLRPRHAPTLSDLSMEIGKLTKPELCIELAAVQR
ncbi:hypothetical protein C8R44DRAFT_878685 [Mycena epipterygia]|nr:hypothetical protein C8R44DRAFT_878685 [Mycena epipterygia]